jgi:endonuclease/exonuclease/phosphatase family metal-dependent hydrolase
VARPLVACTWNLELGRRLDEILRAVRSESDFRDVGVLFLQEASEHGGEDSAAIAAALGPGFLWRQEPVHVLRGAPQANGLVWDSRRVELTEPRAFQLPVSALAGQTRGALTADGVLDGAISLRVISAHLDVIGYEHRSRQLTTVLGAGSAAPRPQLTLIGGDFNTFGVHGVPSWARLRAEVVANGFTELTADVAWTHRHRALRVRQKLDAIFAASQGPLRHRAWALPIDASDHLPVFAEVASG